MFQMVEDETHYVGNDTVETRSFVTKAIFAGGELTEILSSLGNHIVKQFHGNPTTAER